MGPAAGPVVDPAAAPVVGMVGAGQLARMTAQAAIALGVGFRVLAEAADDSAAQVTAGAQVGDYRSLDDLLAFAAGCDVLTFDHEHVPGDHLAALADAGVAVRPGAAALALTQDKLLMRRRLTGLGVPCPRYAAVADLADVDTFAQGRWPVVLKAVSGGYDGRGVWVCESPAQAAAVLGHGAPGHGALARRPRVAAPRAWPSWPRSTSSSTASWPCWRPAHRTGRAPSTRSSRPSSGTGSAAR